MRIHKLSSRAYVNAC